MSHQALGGFPEPRFYNVPAATDGIRIQLPAATIYFQISNTGGNPVRVYFTQAAFDADSAAGAAANNDEHIELDATTGYLEGPFEINQVWLRGVGGTSTVYLIATRKKA